MAADAAEYRAANAKAVHDSDYEPSIPDEYADAVHEEFEEGVEKSGLRKPLQPTQQEIDEHQITHVPYRDWCAHCVRGKAHTAPHLKSAGSKLPEQRPTIAMDYFYLGKREDSSMPILGVVEETTRRCFSITLPCKGLEHQYNVAILQKVIKVLGLQFGVLKSDTERSIVALRDAVQLKFPNLSVENATKGESQSNGLIESMIGKMEAQARTLKSALQDRYQLQLDPKHPILPWLVDYSGALISRFQRGADGRTPYERSARKPWRVKLPEFGECVLYQPLKGESSGSKLDPRFENGVYLGIQEGSALKWIGTEEGVVRCWSIKRKPDSERWDAEHLNRIVGLPWQLRPPVDASRSVERGPLELKIDEAPVPEMLDKVVEKRRKGYVPRGLYIRKDVELKEHGYTPGCDGCDAAQHGLSHRQHSRACRARISEAIASTEQGKRRLELIKDREEQFMVRYHESQSELADKKRQHSGVEDAGESKSMKPADRDAEIVDVVLGNQEVPGVGGASSSMPSSVAQSGVGQGGPDLQDSGASNHVEVEGDVDMGEVNQAEAPRMDIGSLHRMIDQHGAQLDKDFVQSIREASYYETMDLMHDDEISRTRLGMQLGSISLADSYSLTKPVVAELYSRPRVTEFGQRKGILTGVAFDLTTNDEDGQPWDFRLKSQRDKAANMIQELQPDLLVGSPMCGPFSNLQNLNMRTQEAREKVRENEKEAIQHLEYCVEQYEAQISRGRWFLHEHPQTARSWRVRCIEQLASRPDVYKITGHMCRHGMVSQDQFGQGLVKKPTTFLTNSRALADELEVKCTNDFEAIGVHRQTDKRPRTGVDPRNVDFGRSMVVRRVTLDVDKQVVLQDLRDASTA